MNFIFLLKILNFFFAFFLVLLCSLVYNPLNAKLNFTQKNYFPNLAFLKSIGLLFYP